MQRFMNIYGGTNNNGVEGNVSVMSSDMNWNELSIGINDTIAENNFFGRKHPEHEPKGKIQKDDMFLDIGKNGTDENKQNANAELERNSLESENNLSLSFDEGLRIGQRHSQNGRKPLAQHNQVPNVYAQGQLYKQRKEFRMKLLEKKERDQRKFHAKPAPNFNAIHVAQSKKRTQEEPKITIPKTPQVVRSHRHYADLAKAKQDELIASLKPKPFVSKEAEVLKLPPYIPRPNKKTPTEPAPFKLHSDERLRDRREYDKKFEEKTERKQREQEERHKIEEGIIRRQLRQQTTFKANPNPFSGGK
ncbi:targeting protein for Xklp2-like [Sitodiplosis mosellana]|uniref:targeting protein for Xklp2-like n=1 Tax=Sitodiplosis mosellana TaxID=263140 RepID=UPI002444BE5F|nr:targeting protein for Xklp2-like [Sitodiplosis mosellana]